MMKIKYTNQSDMEEALKLEKRRQFEEERKKRIFNARQRLFGLDWETLKRQEKEKLQLRSKAEESERLWDKEMHNQQLAVQAHVLEEAQKKRVLESDLNSYRCLYQRPETRREFDINDPNIIKNSEPPRFSDDDPSLGISSAQVFSGEDVGHENRKLRQRAQQRSWLQQQMNERKAAEAARAKADNLMLGSMLDREKRMSQMAESEQRVRLETVEAVSHYNLNMAAKKRLDHVQEKKERWEDDLAEIYNMLSSDMLSENPNVAQSCTHPNKKIAYMYRGMSPEELKIFQKEQRQQIVEMKKMRSDEQMKGKLWEKMEMDMDREIRLKKLDMDRKRSQEVKEFIQKNGELAREQRKQRHLENENKRNVISDDFFDQFNRNSR